MSNSERQPLLHTNPNRSWRRSSRQSLPPTPTSPTTNGTLFNNNGNSRNFNRIRFASAAILLSLVFERIAFYGLAGNLVLFLNKDPFKWESYHAVDASLFFFGMSFVMSLIGGWLADAILGRFKAIVISFVIYIAGYVFMPLMTTRQKNDVAFVNVSLPNICKWGDGRDKDGDGDTDPFDEPCASMIFIALTVITIGTGFVKANIAPFGSDQVSAIPL